MHLQILWNENQFYHKNFIHQFLRTSFSDMAQLASALFSNIQSILVNTCSRGEIKSLLYFFTFVVITANIFLQHDQHFSEKF